MTAASKREQIIDGALRLFTNKGFTATGVDEIIEETSVSKKTLYKHFRSKDELVLATLRKRDELFRNHMMRELDKLSISPHARLLSIFDVVGKWLQEETFVGCIFINASAEYSDPEHSSRIFCAEHKRLMRDYIHGIAVEAGAEDPKELSKQLNLLIQGSIVNAHVEGDRHAACIAKEMAQVFIHRALK